MPDRLEKRAGPLDLSPDAEPVAGGRINAPGFHFVVVVAIVVSFENPAFFFLNCQQRERKKHSLKMVTSPPCCRASTRT